MALAVHGRSEFDTDADVDIATMAAQRDQLRGARNVRGMMAPVMSKEVRRIQGFFVRSSHNDFLLGDLIYTPPFMMMGYNVMYLSYSFHVLPIIIFFP